MIQPWPALANRVRAALDAGGVVQLNHPAGWVRIVGVGQVLHVRRELVDEAQSGASP